MSIIISKNGKNAEKVEPANFEKEDFLQQYIYQNPDCLPLDEIEEDIRLLIVAREFSTPSGPIDALGTDRNGSLYVIETKLYKNPDKRLVVAQVLDYGASLWKGYGDFDGFMQELDSRARSQFGVGFDQKVMDFFGLAEEEVPPLRDGLRVNLSEGRFRFVVLMDKLHDRLKDLILFINQNSRFDLYGVELEYYKYDAYEIMIPKLYGTEVKKEVEGFRTGGRKWDEASFFDAAAKNLAQMELEAVRRVFEFSTSIASEIVWGIGKVTGSFTVRPSVLACPLYHVFSNGLLTIRFNELDGNERTRRFREELRAALEKLGGFDLPADYPNRWFRIQAKAWVPKVDDLIGVLRGLLNDAKASQ